MNVSDIPFDKRLLEEDAEDLYQHAPCGYLSTLLDGRIVKANATILSWLGHPAELLAGQRRFQDLLTLPGKIYHDTHYQPLLAMQGHVREIAFDLIDARGGILPVLLNANLRRDADGQPLFVRVTLLDARNRRSYERELLLAKRRAEQAEAALRELNQDLEREVAERTAEQDRLWRSAQDVLAVSTLQGRLLRWNPAFARLLGTHGELGGMQFGELVAPEHRAQFETAREGLAVGKPVSQLRLAHHCAGERICWLSWNIVAQNDSLYLVGRDVTEEQRHAEALRQTEEALRQAHKAEALGHLTGGLAHDFNNLLAGISGNLQLIRLRMARGEHDMLPRYVAAAEAVVDRASGLTQRLLAFARRQTLSPEASDTNDLVRSMCDLIRQTIGPQIELVFQLDPKAGSVLADRNQLESALLNLAINARDAMPGGGRLTISTQRVASDARNGNGTSQGARVLIAVADTGTGMSPEVMERAFDPFFTTKPVGQGTGLGLSMIYGFATQSRGHVRLESAPGQGTKVKLYLPAAEQARAEPAADPPPAASVATRGARILLVEDEEALRALLTEALGELHHTVCAASRASEALDLLDSGRSFDLLITDIGLPGDMNGQQLAELVRARAPEMKVLLITGYVHEPALRERVAKERLEIMLKPFSILALNEKVHELVGLNEG